MFVCECMHVCVRVCVCVCSPSITQHSADDVGIVDPKVVVAHGAPASVNHHLQSALGRFVAVDEPDTGHCEYNDRHE